MKVLGTSDCSHEPALLAPGYANEDQAENAVLRVF